MTFRALFSRAKYFLRQLYFIDNSVESNAGMDDTIAKKLAGWILTEFNVGDTQNYISFTKVIGHPPFSPFMHEAFQKNRIFRNGVINTHLSSPAGARCLFSKLTLSLKPNLHSGMPLR